MNGAKAVRALGLVLISAVARAAEPTHAQKCADEYSDCHDSCALRFGMVTKDSERVKLAKCIDRCKQNDQQCQTRELEAKSSNVDESALKADKHDDDVRKDEKPAETKAKKEPEKKKGEKKKDDDWAR
ncbi:MAG: hypothetical protein IPJ65_26295 [Archangiaceae bacterium]|nr:hypothetical protein [Archangiaceae bacterium]